MKKRLMACLTSVCMLAAVLLPVGGTIADEPISETPPVVVSEPAPAPEPAKPEKEEAPAPEQPAPEPGNAGEATAEPAHAPTTEPAHAPTAEVSVGPTAESTHEPTAEPAVEPTAEASAGPTVEPAVEPTAEPATEPTAEPSVEPTMEPTPEPSMEPTAEPTLEPEKLLAKLSLDRRYAFANEDSVTARIEFAGGVAPYALTLKVNGAVCGQPAELTEAGAYAFSHMPSEFGVHTFEITVTDAVGMTASASAKLPVAVRVDVEHSADWERTFRDVQLSGDWREDLLAIARTQLGYRESERNFIIDDSGKQQGYTRYGDWYGASYSEWCAMFVSFCLHYAQIPSSAVPRSAGCEGWKEAMIGLGAFERRGEYIPESGDLIFFDWVEDATGKRDGSADHVGIVEYVSGSTVHTIEGNAGREVRRREYDVNDGDIMGYASLTALMERAGLIEDEPAVRELQGYTAITACDSVNVREAANENSAIVAQLPLAGTELAVHAEVTRANGEIWYGVAVDGVSGYVRGDLLVLSVKIEFGVPQVWNVTGGVNIGYAEAVEGAHYIWQKRGVDETGAELWEDVGEGAVLQIPAEAGALLAYYRCVIAFGGEETTTEAVRPVRGDMVEWLQQDGLTADMICRALNTSTLDAITLENNELIYVRIGEMIASYDPETGIVVDAEMGIPVGRIVNGKLSPLVSDETAAGPEAQPIAPDAQ